MDIPGSLSAEDLRSRQWIEVCDAGRASGRIVGLRGLARAKGEVLLMSDATCSAGESEASAIPLRIRVVVASFRSPVDLYRFQRVQDTFESPVFQVLVRGKLSCRLPIRVSPSRQNRMTDGNGYGASGTVACVVERAVVEGLWLL